jgi:hypothetical protein
VSESFNARCLVVVPHEKSIESARKLLADTLPGTKPLFLVDPRRRRGNADVYGDDLTPQALYRMIFGREAVRE